MKQNKVRQAHIQDSDLSGAEAALRRAAQRAKEKAEAHGLKVLVYSEKESKTERCK